MANHGNGVKQIDMILSRYRQGASPHQRSRPESTEALLEAKHLAATMKGQLSQRRSDECWALHEDRKRGHEPGEVALEPLVTQMRLVG